MNEIDLKLGKGDGISLGLRSGRIKPGRGRFNRENEIVPFILMPANNRRWAAYRA